MKHLKYFKVFENQETKVVKFEEGRYGSPGSCSLFINGVEDENFERNKTIAEVLGGVYLDCWKDCFSKHSDAGYGGHPDGSVWMNYLSRKGIKEDYKQLCQAYANKIGATFEEDQSTYHYDY